MKVTLKLSSLAVGMLLGSSLSAAAEFSEVVIKKRAAVGVSHAQGVFKSQFYNQQGLPSFQWYLQGENQKRLNLKKVSKTSPENALKAYFERIAANHGANKQTISQAELQFVHDTGRGGIIGRFQQMHDGLEVFGRALNLLLDRKLNLVASSGTLTPNRLAKQSEFILTPERALAIGFEQNTGEKITDLVLNPAKTDGFAKLAGSQFNSHLRLHDNSRVKPVYFAADDNSLRAAYYVEAITSAKGDRDGLWRSYVIDATTGEVLFSNDLTAHVETTYRVFADAAAPHMPMDGPQGNALTPHPTGDLADTPPLGEGYGTPNTITLDFGPISTQDPWLDAQATTTTGNNVDAYADISGEDGFDAQDVRPSMTSSNAFEYDFAPFKDGLSGDGQNHAIVSLFYTNNFLHDWFYDNGFDEASGNAQNDNYGRGGVGGDALRVEAQDFSGANNANMSTPSDGSAPRMQMFIWDFLSDAGIDITGVNVPEVGGAAFGPAEFDVTGTLMNMADDTDPASDGCETTSQDLTNAVVIIDRGSCNFTVKVKNAQDAGATAVIMVNNKPDSEEGVIAMGGDDATITIPSLFVANSVGTSIRDALSNDPSLQARLFKQEKPIDGTLDNGIVAHEWAHYLTNRLVGNANGLSNNQGRSMGEGWSDFVALLMMVRESDLLQPGNDQLQGVYSASTFVGNAYFGIRRAPYSTDFNKNALTFKHIEAGVPLPNTHPLRFGSSGNGNAEVHASGEIWANVLWEIFVALVNKPGYSFEQAREVMKDYLVASLKMTPNAPTMLEARDALLAVAVANDVEDFKLMRAAFIKRGMGAGAVAPDRNSDDHAGVVEDFSPDVDAIVRASFAAGGLSNLCDDDGIWDVGETLQLDLTAVNFSAASLPAFDLQLSSTDDVTMPASATTTVLSKFGDSQQQSISVTLNSASLQQSIDVDVTAAEIGANASDFVEPSTVTASRIANFDLLKDRFDDDMSVAATSQADWTVNADSGLQPFVIDQGGWYGVDNGAPGSSVLITPVLKVAGTGDFSLNFNHFFFFEVSDDPNTGEPVNWDGGVIEISIDGADWVDVTSVGGILQEAYNGTIVDSNPILGGREAYVATRDPNNLSMQSNAITFPDGTLNGHNVQIRFHIGTDQSVGDFGWLIDNVVVNNVIDPVFSSVVAEDNICVSGSAPTVDAGSDQVIRVSGSDPISVQLNASGSDADGDTLSYSWVQRSGPAVTLSAADSASTEFTIDAPSADTELNFEVTVSDGQRTASDVVSIQLKLNTAPTVSASGMTVNEGATATLTATASDAEGDSLTYSWTQTAGPSVTLNNADSATPNFVAPEVSATTSLTFEVVVSDGDLQSAPASATVTVNDVPEPPPPSGGGGGSLPTYLLLLLTMLGIRRKR